ncbi:MAG: GerMN domain-containing protein [Terriglobales bacterium]
MPSALTIAAIVLIVVVAALGGYVMYLKRSAESPQAHAADARPITPPVAGIKTQVTLVLASDADSSLNGTAREVVLPLDPAARPREILRALVAQYIENGSTHKIGAGADVNEVYVVGHGLAVVDVNAALADGHPSGILVEQLTLASLGETLAANVPGITRVKFLVDGKERYTLAGHAGLAEPYQVMQAPKQ